MATLSLGVVRGQKLMPRLSKQSVPIKSKKAQKVDTTVRLATSEDSISNSKLGLI